MHVDAASTGVVSTPVITPLRSDAAVSAAMLLQPAFVRRFLQPRRVFAGGQARPTLGFRPPKFERSAPDSLLPTLEFLVHGLRRSG